MEADPVTEQGMEEDFGSEVHQSGEVPQEGATVADATPAEPPPVPLTPPEDCEAITPDGAVLKKILEPGEPDTRPSLHARCLIHYVGYLTSNGDKFMDTRRDKESEEPVVVVAGRKTSAQETGLCLAAATMGRGERALVYVTDPSYGYGSMGSFSFPCVPPDSCLVYDVEMISWDSIDEADNDRDRGGLLFEERLERAERRRLSGNELYKAGNFKGALAKYAMALSYMDEDFMFQLEGHYLDKAEAVKLAVHLNMAAAQLNTGDYNTAIYNCGQVLTLDPKNAKALFRRGKAHLAMGRTDEAEKDLMAAYKLDPADKGIIAERHALRAMQVKERQAEDALFRGKIAKPIAATPAPAEGPSQPAAAAGAAAASEQGGSGASVSGGAGLGSPAGTGSQASKRAAASAAGKGGAGGKQQGGGAATVASRGGSKAAAARDGSRGGGGMLAAVAAFFLMLWARVLAGLGVRALPQRAARVGGKR